MPCLNTETKDALIEVIDKSKIPSSEAEVLAEFVEGLPKCTTEEVPLGRKGKRPLSKYNIFLSGCLRKEKMDSCIPKWRIVKECIKNGGNFDSCKAQQGY